VIEVGLLKTYRLPKTCSFNLISCTLNSSVGVYPDISYLSMNMLYSIDKSRPTSPKQTFFWLYVTYSANQFLIKHYDVVMEEWNLWLFCDNYWCMINGSKLKPKKKYIYRALKLGSDRILNLLRTIFQCLCYQNFYFKCFFNLPSKLVFNPHNIKYFVTKAKNVMKSWRYSSTHHNQ